MGRILSIWGFPSVSSYIFMFIDLNDVKINIDMTLLFESIQILISDFSNIGKLLWSEVLMISHNNDNFSISSKNIK